MTNARLTTTVQTENKKQLTATQAQCIKKSAKLRSVQHSCTARSKKNQKNIKESQLFEIFFIENVISKTKK